MRILTMKSLRKLMKYSKSYPYELLKRGYLTDSLHEKYDRIELNEIEILRFIICFLHGPPAMVSMLRSSTLTSDHPLLLCEWWRVADALEVFHCKKSTLYARLKQGHIVYHSVQGTSAIRICGFGVDKYTGVINYEGLSEYALNCGPSTPTGLEALKRGNPRNHPNRKSRKFTSPY